jgi:hypothetical protein
MDARRVSASVMNEPVEMRPDDPHGEYARRREARRAAAAEQERRYRQIWHGRRAAVIAGALIAWLALGLGWIGWWWLALPVIGYLALAVLHERVAQTRQQLERAAAVYERGLARLEDRWAGTGETGERFLDRSHPYAEDLDLFGKGSLFELLCAARTRAGENTLAAWLLAPAPLDEVRARQAAVDELRPRLDLREALARRGEELRSGVDPESLAAWAGAEPVKIARWERWIAPALAALTAASLVLWIALGWGKVFLAVLILRGAITLRWRARAQRIISGIDRPVRELALLSHLLAQLERERFTALRLVKLRAELDTDGLAPSQQIARFERLIDLLDAPKNQFFAPFAFLLLWSPQVAFAIEAWRQKSGPAVSRWLSAVGEIEALCSLAGYAYEHPADPFPELIADGACFEGEGLGHPLLAEARCVRNDLRLGRERRVLIVSGSNMSGKSTLLRTVGVNVVLALAGAPARARRLRLSPLAVGASIHIQDSLQTGSSHFYAEITRLRQIVDLAKGERPLLFLLDEILHGTNSHDRRIGAEAVVRGLVARGAIGLVTTHDLALARIVDELAPRAANVHFQDEIKDGRMSFDYRMHPGVVERSNALELMRSVGLEV